MHEYRLENKAANPAIGGLDLWHPWAVPFF
jgi:hypothetical protein